MQNHFTADEWTEYVRRNFKSVGDAERWRNQNNVFVDDLPAPTYTGPLASGGSSGELPPVNPSQTPVYAPQGTQKMDEEEVPGGLDAANAAAATGDEGDLDAFSLANMTPQNIFSKLAALQARASKVSTGMSAADYSEAEAKIKARRYGPSRTEQLFQLAAALGKPTLSRGFGEIMGNVAPALADAAKANREAEAARQDALSALKRQYLLEGRQGEMAKIAAEQKILGTAAALAKPRTPVSKAYTDQQGIMRHKIYATPITQPPMDKILALQQYLANPSNTPENKQATMRSFDATYGYGASDIFGDQ